MKSRLFSIAVFVLLLLSGVMIGVHFQTVKAGSTWVVDKAGSGDFTKIQCAIDASTTMPDDTIFVHSGVYYEHVDITKSISLIGENSTTTIIDGNGTFIVVSVVADDVLIRGFTIRNGEMGIQAVSQVNLTIAENNITGHKTTEAETSGYGIYTRYCSGISIQRNIIVDNEEGVLVSDYSQNFVVEENEVLGNTGVGLSANLSSYGLIVNNKVYENSGVYGIDALNSTNCEIFGNTVTRNSGTGISVEDSSNIRVYDNNIINNDLQAYAYPVIDWNYSVEGNYWSDYTGNDMNYDGVGDQPYIENFTLLPEYVIDYHPLMGLASSFNAFEDYFANIVSNSTIVDFEFFVSNSSMKLHVVNSSVDQTGGFCRVRIPYHLLTPLFNATVDDADPLYSNYTLYDDGENRWIYFQYSQSANESEIIIRGSDAIPPKITVLSPESTAYLTNSVSLTFTLSEPTSWIGYSLDDHANATISGNYSLTGLNDGTHSIVVYANDTVGNMGHSAIISFTIDMASPDITILSPENKTYATTSISLNFMINEQTAWIGYQLDTQANVTITGNTTLSSLAEENHWITVYANDTYGHMGHSITVYFKVDITAPIVQVISPENKTYTSSSVSLNFSVSEESALTYYSLDGEANVTVSGNATLTGLVDGVHSIRVYAQDAAGSTGASALVYFSVNTQPQEAFPIWMLAVVGIVGVAIAIIVGVYFMKVRKTK